MKTFLKLNAKIAISVVAAGVLISIAFISTPEQQKNLTIEKKKVAPPFKNVNLKYANYTVNAQESSVLNYESGTEINIPAGAFVDEKGKPVEGFVDLQYRELHDPVDFFLSGIPMTYDSAGTEYHFESAGMLEILAFQNGKPVFVNPDKKIIVEMVSEQQEDKYNIYRFDSVSGNWKYIYKDNASGEKKSENTRIMISAKLQIPTASQITGMADVPVKPERADGKNYHFDLEVDLQEFPEVSVYKDVQFEVKNGEKDFDKSYVSIVWNDVSLKKNNNGSYLMTLVSGTELHTFEVKPVFDGVSYEKAYEEYSMLLEEKKRENRREQRIIDSIRAAWEKERVFQTALAKDNLRNEAASMQTQDIVQRVFVISGFGIWNSDCPAKLPQGEEFAAIYTDSTVKKLQFKTLYLVEKGRNAMFAITSYTRLYYDPSKKNLLWAVTADNKLAVFEEDRFKDLKEKNDSCVVQMKVIDKSITKAYEVRDALHF
jgi:hypothetical protein